MKHLFNEFLSEQWEICRAPNCWLMVKTSGYCGGHYQQIRKNKPLKPLRYIGPRFSGTIHHTGYKYIFIPEHPNADSTGRVAEHRMVMSQVLGRPLYESESVHHKNGDKLDNRPENLELWSKKHPYGQKVPDLVAWAKQILELYGTQS